MSRGESLKVAAISSLFNPAGFVSQNRNFKVFAARLRAQEVPLFVAHAGQPAVRSDAGTCIRQVGSTAAIWLKEHLLNVAARALPPEFDTVAWIDADVILPDGWPRLLEVALESNRFVQLFEEIIRLPPGARDDDGLGDCLAGAAANTTRQSLTAARSSHLCTGYAWAARRDFFDNVGLYEGAIIGGGDHLAFHAFLREIDSPCLDATIGRDGPMYADFTQWATRVGRFADGTVGHIPTTALHLWHGHPARRRYTGRWKVLHEFGFNPATDIDWSASPIEIVKSKRADLGRAILEYFVSRNEDSDCTSVPGSSSAFRF